MLFFARALGSVDKCKKSPSKRHIHHISGARVTVHLHQDGIGRHLLTSVAFSGPYQIPLTLDCNPIVFYHLLFICRS